MALPSTKEARRNVPLFKTINYLLTNDYRTVIEPLNIVA